MEAEAVSFEVDPKEIKKERSRLAVVAQSAHNGFHHAVHVVADTLKIDPTSDIIVGALYATIADLVIERAVTHEAGYALVQKKLTKDRKTKKGAPSSAQCEGYG